MENLLPTLATTDVTSNQFRESTLPYQQWEVRGDVDRRKIDAVTDPNRMVPHFLFERRRGIKDGTSPQENGTLR